MKYQTEDGKLFDNLDEARDWESFINWYSDNKLRTPQRHVVEPEAAYAWVREYNSVGADPLAERCAEGSEITDEFQYNWDEISKEYQWMATDEDGQIWAYSKHPHLHIERGMWSSFESKVNTYYSAEAAHHPNWKDSLRKRPEPCEDHRHQGYYCA